MNSISCLLKDMNSTLELQQRLKSTPHAGRIGNLIWATLRGLVVAQMVWPEPVDSSRDLKALVDVITAYVESRSG